MLRGWCFPSTAWLVLFNIGLSFVFVYGLAASDHHMAERIPLHSHVLVTGAAVPGHVHTFGQMHAHAHSGAPSEVAGGGSVMTTTAPLTLLETWSTQIAPASVSISLLEPGLDSWTTELRVLRDQLSQEPLIRPPSRSSPNAL